MKQQLSIVSLFIIFSICFINIVIKTTAKNFRVVSKAQALDKVHQASKKIDEFIAGLNQVVKSEMISEGNKNVLSQLWPWQEINESFKAAQSQPSILKNLYIDVFEKCFEKLDTVLDIHFINWFLTNERFTFFTEIEGFGKYEEVKEKNVQNDLELFYSNILSRAMLANYLAGLKQKVWVMDPYLIEREAFFFKRGLYWSDDTIENLFIKVKKPLAFAQSVFEHVDHNFFNLVSQENFIEYRHYTYRVAMMPIVLVGLSDQQKLRKYNSIKPVIVRLSNVLMRNANLLPYLEHGKISLLGKIEAIIDMLTVQILKSGEVESEAIDFSI